MRVVFLGAGTLTVLTARRLLEEGHEVVIIEEDAARIDELSEELDCGFVHGDGSRPSVLREISPENTDFLFGMSDSDQDNILASLVARSLGVERTVTKVEDADFEGICRELGLQDTIVPAREAARSLADMVRGEESAPLSGALREGLRFFTFAVGSEQAGPLRGLELPADSRVVAVTRDDASHLPDDETRLEEKDRVLLVATEQAWEALRERFGEPGRH
jgi:trk system potassium uptake protein TrkA